MFGCKLLNKKFCSGPKMLIEIHHVARRSHRVTVWVKFHLGKVFGGFLSALEEAPLMLASSACNRTIQLLCIFQICLTVFIRCSYMLPLSTVPLTTAYCLLNGKLFSITFLLGREKPESGLTCVLQPCQFRGTSVRFVFCLLRSEFFFFFLALTNHESWASACFRNVLPLVV